MSLPSSPLQSSTANTRHKILDKLALVNPQDCLPRLSGEVISVCLEDANRDPMTIPIISITQTNKLVNATAALILEMLGYMIKKSITYLPWKMRLKAKIKATWREFS